MSVCPSVGQSAWNNSTPNEPIFIKFVIWAFFENLSRKFRFHWNATKNNGYFLRRPMYIFDLSRSVLLRKKNVSHKSCRETRNTHFMSNNFFFNRAIYEKMWKNDVQWSRPRMTIWRMRIACWIPKATNKHTHTHTGCVIPIAFPLQ
jgi:hypothetical protein